MLTDLTVKEYIERLAGGEATPGGGSVSALAGALSAALSRMVCNLTIGRKGNDAALDERMAGIERKAAELGRLLIEGVDRDAEAYVQVMKGYRMPKTSEAEGAAREAAIQEALKEATRAPLDAARAACTLIDLAKEAVTYGNKNAYSDGVAAELCARAAVLGAAANVRINLPSIKDEAFRESTLSEIEALEKKALDKGK